MSGHSGRFGFQECFFLVFFSNSKFSLQIKFILSLQKHIFYGEKDSLLLNVFLSVIFWLYVELPPMCKSFDLLSVLNKVNIWKKFVPCNFIIKRFD